LVVIEIITEVIWSLVGEMNRYIDEKTLWALANTDEAAAKTVITDLIFTLRRVAVWVEPFMPATKAEMKKRLAQDPVQKYAPLFPPHCDYGDFKVLKKLSYKLKP